MAVRKVEHLSLEERQARGKEARHETPVSAHDGWAPAVDRSDPVKLEKDRTARRAAKGKKAAKPAEEAKEAR